MMYYKIQAGLINKSVGYMASHKMADYYNYDLHNSVYNLKIRGKVDFIPDIDAIQILKRAKLMDILVSVPIGSNNMIFSEKLCECIMNSIVPIETQIFDAFALFKEEKYKYKYLYIYDAKEKDIIDWDNSRFLEEYLGPKYTIGSPKKFSFEAFAKSMDEDGKHYTPHKLVIKKDRIITDIIRLDRTFSGYYVSEKLKTAIEEAGCQGVDLIPMDKLGFEVEFV